MRATPLPARGQPAPNESREALLRASGVGLPTVASGPSETLAGGGEVSFRLAQAPDPAARQPR